MMITNYDDRKIIEDHSIKLDMSIIFAGDTLEDAIKVLQASADEYDRACMKVKVTVENKDYYDDYYDKLHEWDEVILTVLRYETDAEVIARRNAEEKAKEKRARAREKAKLKREESCKINIAHEKKELKRLLAKYHPDIELN